jgi:cyclopropane fatty-acyl-phospholipid synthase-like methyltransferase
MINVNCIVCGLNAGEPIFASEGRSLTTMMDVIPEATVVRFCKQCGHLQTDALPDIERYYSVHYKLLANSEDEDQLLVLRDGNTVLRNQHQLEILLEKVQLPSGANILDYGCAKSSVMRLLLDRRSDLVPHLFDVTDIYVPFWKKFMPEGSWATHDIPEEWAGKFDLITSFFALEHVISPVVFLKEIRRLLSSDGLFYCIVPNAYDNIADFIVADHVSHFSLNSIVLLLQRSGFDIEMIDSNAHPGAWIFIGRKAPSSSLKTDCHSVSDVNTAAAHMADYWLSFGSRVREFECKHAGDPAVIYGSGFYGMYMLTNLRYPERISCFLDQNPHRQGQFLSKLPIHAPQDIPHETKAIYAGLNPRIARSALANVPSLSTLNFNIFYP